MVKTVARRFPHHQLFQECKIVLVLAGPSGTCSAALAQAIAQLERVIPRPREPPRASRISAQSTRNSSLRCGSAIADLRGQGQCRIAINAHLDSRRNDIARPLFSYESPTSAHRTFRRPARSSPPMGVRAAARAQTDRGSIKSLRRPPDCSLYRRSRNARFRRKAPSGISRGRAAVGHRNVGLISNRPSYPRPAHSLTAILAGRRRKFGDRSSTGVAGRIRRVARDRASRRFEGGPFSGANWRCCWSLRAAIAKRRRSQIRAVCTRPRRSRRFARVEYRAVFGLVDIISMFNYN